MAKVIFTIQYELKADKKEEYLSVVRELKNLLKDDDLQSYEVYRLKGKGNHFQEIYTFQSEQAYEDFDDNQNERINILINKLSDLTVENTTKYSTLYQIAES